MLITARTNEQVKRVKALQAARERRETGLHVAEGGKLVGEAAAAGLVVTAYAVEGHEQEAPAGVPLFSVTQAVMDAMSETRTPQPLLAVVKTPAPVAPDAFPAGLLILLERVQDPGNVGAILRSADALGAAGVLCSADCADVFSGKAIRASMGSCYHVPLYVGELPLTELAALGYTLVCGDLKGSETLPPLSARTALVIGNEGGGVSAAVSAACYRYRLPMRGHAESLNAAVFASLLMDRLTGR